MVGKRFCGDGMGEGVLGSGWGRGREWRGRGALWEQEVSWMRSGKGGFSGEVGGYLWICWVAC